MDKFSLMDADTKVRWDFEINPDRSVTIGLPGIKVVHKTGPLDFDPKVEFEGSQDAWIEWASELLLEEQVVVFDEDEGLLTAEQLEEVEQERGWERDHIRQESDPWKYLH